MKNKIFCHYSFLIPGRAKDLSAPLYCEKLFADIKLYEGFSCFVLRNSLKNFSKHIRHTLYNYTINTTF